MHGLGRTVEGACTHACAPAWYEGTWALTRHVHGAWGWVVLEVGEGKMGISSGLAELAVVPLQLGQKGERPLHTRGQEAMEEPCQQKVQTVSQPCRQDARGAPSATQAHTRTTTACQVHTSPAGPGVHALSSRCARSSSTGTEVRSPLQVPR